MNSNMSNSDTSDNDTNMYPPLTTKEAAPDILALVNDAATAASSDDDNVSAYSDDGGNSNGDINIGIDVDETPPPPASAKEVALDILALENDAAAASASASTTGGIPIYYSDGSNGVGNNGGLPFAPMMTYQKYLTMQVRVRLVLLYKSYLGYVILFAAPSHAFLML